MVVYVLICLGVSFLYLIIQWYLRLVFNSNPTSDILDLKIHSKKVSVIIPCRNEIKTIIQRIVDIQNSSYPNHLIEIIIIDDFSDDGTAIIVQEFLQKTPNSNIKLLSLSDITTNDNLPHKKLAIEFAIKNASGEYILLSDADCRNQPTWVSAMVQHLETNQLDLATGPVLINAPKSKFDYFQGLDFAAMMGVTCAGIHSKKFFLANGANLIFTKSAFDAVDGYSDYRHVASGDDVFLAKKISERFPNKIGFVKSADAIVYTNALPTWNQFIHQRLRWSGKTNLLRNNWINGIALSIGLHHVLILTSVLGLLIDFQTFGKLLFFQLSVKIFIDYAFLSDITKVFKTEYLLKYFPSAEFYHLVYLPIVAVLSVFGLKPKWKGRLVPSVK